MCKLSFDSSTFAWSQLSESAGVLTCRRERFKYKSDRWNEIVKMFRRPQPKVQLDADDVPTPELLIDDRSKLTWLTDRLWRGVTDPLLRSLGTESIKTNCSPVDCADQPLCDKVRSFAVAIEKQIPITDWPTVDLLYPMHEASLCNVGRLIF
ncbi:Polyribonucleotide nucleotidyltransferase [Trichinella spiralis]|uniref:Polyribonucleotide nucleotidyltransferase n=1 Tax=Trichinella spiralis TaxID=6334 RepID=A0ABR3KRQ1_TRISP